MLIKILKLIIVLSSSLILGFKVYSDILYINEEELEKISADYFLEEIEDSAGEEISQEIISEEKDISSYDIIDYTFVLEIPKINLKKGILDIGDKDNNIDKNVTILEESSYPDSDGNIFIASHSGTGSKSFFNDLVKLEIGDISYLYYNGVKYTYEVYDIKTIDKISNSSILTNGLNKMLLITCSQTDKSKYLIIYLEKQM